jgi:hypothetical protein
VSDVVRIAMWSGPRNISTAMMRSFGTRPDAWVIDEPFYAAYLANTAVQHPMREEVLASQPTDWRKVAPTLLADPPHGRRIFYQKHMTHHMLPDFGLDWMKQCRNAFLIRDPELVLASYTVKRGEVELADIGFVQQSEIFAREADRLGRTPPVIEGADVLRDPASVLSKLCAALEIPWTTDAELARRPPRDRRRLGARLVRRRRKVHRLRPAAARNAARPARPSPPHRGSRAPALRGAGDVEDRLTAAAQSSFSK